MKDNLQIVKQNVVIVVQIEKKILEKVIHLVKPWFYKKYPHQTEILVVERNLIRKEERKAY